VAIQGISACASASTTGAVYTPLTPCAAAISRANLARNPYQGMSLPDVPSAADAP